MLYRWAIVLFFVLASTEPSRAILATNQPDLLWPGGRIPFTLDPDSMFTSQEEQIITQARMLIESAVNAGTRTYLKFPPKGANDRNFITFRRRNVDTCQSNEIGRAGGQQFIDINFGFNHCRKPDVIAHEILHAAGLYHEHSRNDRDNFIELQWANVPDDTKEQFEKKPRVSMDIGPYDFRSLLHYNSVLGSSLGVAIKRRDGLSGLGPTGALTAADIAGIRLLYSASAPKVPPTTTQRILTIRIENLKLLQNGACDARMYYDGRIVLESGWSSIRSDDADQREPLAQLRTLSLGADVNPEDWVLEHSAPAGETKATAYIRIDRRPNYAAWTDSDINDRSASPYAQCPHVIGVDINPLVSNSSALCNKHIALKVDLEDGSVFLAGCDPGTTRVGRIGETIRLAGTEDEFPSQIELQFSIR